jgi:hypothetical protein
MRFAAMVCALALLASPYFFAHYEAERLLGWPQAAYLWFNAWLPFVLVLVTSPLIFGLPWIVGLFCEKDRQIGNHD